jgi:hypothetical protein
MPSTERIGWWHGALTPDGACGTHAVTASDRQGANRWKSATRDA